MTTDDEREISSGSSRHPRACLETAEIRLGLSRGSFHEFIESHLTRFRTDLPCFRKGLTCFCTDFELFRSL